jgi:hypothetical protein
VGADTERCLALARNPKADQAADASMAKALERREGALALLMIFSKNRHPDHVRAEFN